MTLLTRPLACLLVAVTALAFATAAQAGDTYNFNSDWRLNVGEVAGRAGTVKVLRYHEMPVGWRSTL